MEVINNLESLLGKMWSDYAGMNPQIQKIHDLFVSQGNTVINDHIALRTFNDPRVGIEILAKPFLESGYKEGGDYHFEQKKLYAKHFEHSDPRMPKVFISELLLGEFSQGFRDIVTKLLTEVTTDFTNRFDLPTAGRPWSISFEDYETLRSESEYGAWMSAFGFCSNHFTVSVNYLKSTNDLTELNEIIKSSGYELNNSGGEIKGTPDVFLEQSSTLADRVEIEFTDTKKVIPACYYEFAKRYELPSGELYQGFVAKSADKIFESTDS